MAQTKTQFGYRRHPDQDRSGANVAEHPVVVVGAGPVGLSLAIDLAQRGQSVVLLDDADRIGEGSRAICFSKRSLEFWDRLGIGQRMVDKGVVWSVGKIFHGASQLYQFNLLPEDGHKRPAFINLQQFYAEAYLVDRVEELAAIDLRWRNKVIGLEQRNDHVLLTIETPGRSVSAARELCRRLRRRALLAAADGRCGIRRASVRGPVPDRRRQDDRGVSDRALVLVRSAVPCRAVGAVAQAAGRYLAHRPAASARTPIPWSRSVLRMCGRGSHVCSATTSSISNGSRSTNSSVGGWIDFCMAA